MYFAIFLSVQASCLCNVACIASQTKLSFGSGIGSRRCFASCQTFSSSYPHWNMYASYFSITVVHPSHLFGITLFANGFAFMNIFMILIDSHNIVYCVGTDAPCHRWALSPISVISDIGLSLKSELPISDWESGVWHYIGYRNKVLSDTRYPTSSYKQTVTVA